MKSEQINRHFQQLKQQRDTFYKDKGINFEEPWRRPMPDKWSIGESLYHLLLMVRLFRRFSTIYIPVMMPLAYLRRNKPYKIETHDIYQDYQKKKKKSMNAPLLIKPPEGLANKWSFEETKELLGRETDKLMGNLNTIKQDVAGQIYYPDPIADYPNLVQCVHLLAIHEQHHFNIMGKINK
ncbi:DinB family protein [Virgibacillus necropolis]|uniref:DinB family protein n=1 Tax=Virgibacillus necropolis TaxID=163877 RepID=UPI003850A59E